jgi:hypothetical protein
MKLFRSVLLIIVLIASTSGCKQPVDPPKPASPPRPTDYGLNDYLPLAVGNTWLYSYDYQITSYERDPDL